MAGSKPHIRYAIVQRLSDRGLPVRGQTLHELKHHLGLGNVTDTQFVKAIGSLAYNSKQIVWRRPSSVHQSGPLGGSRSHEIRLVA